jgi:divalent metal cation (Fe/Co/Zn/Cd) transporter
MPKAKSPGENIIKEMSLKSKWKSSLISSFVLIGIGLLLFSEAFYRIKTVSEKPTWLFFLVVSTIVFFIGLHLFSQAIGYKNTIRIKKAVKKMNRSKTKIFEGGDKLEIQKSPQK